MTTIIDPLSACLVIILLVLIFSSCIGNIDIDNLLKYTDKQSQNENIAAKDKYTQKNYPGQRHRLHYQFAQKY